MRETNPQAFNTEACDVTVTKGRSHALSQSVQHVNIFIQKIFPAAILILLVLYNLQPTSAVTMLLSTAVEISEILYSVPEK